MFHPELRTPVIFAKSAEEKGTIYKGHTIQALEQLGVSTRDAKKCAAKLHLAAVRSLYEIIRLRRLLESGMPVGSGRSGNQPPSRTKRPP